MVRKNDVTENCVQRGDIYNLERSADAVVVENLFCEISLVPDVTVPDGRDLSRDRCRCRYRYRCAVAGIS